MNVPRSLFVLGVLVVLGVVALVVVRLVTGEDEDGSAGTEGAELADPSGSFTIAGDVTEPISPGVMVPLDLKITNPHDVTLVVTDLHVRIRDVSAPSSDTVRPCHVGDFAVTQTAPDFEVTVEPGATLTLSSAGLPRTEWPQVGMINRPVNQDGCKGATLTLAYAASGTTSR